MKWIDLLWTSDKLFIIGGSLCQYGSKNYLRFSMGEVIAMVSGRRLIIAPVSLGCIGKNTQSAFYVSW
ncbi:hypothetical protein [Oceanobacillus sp. CFH 90083]|uniref:hypothetical protein n=1 Tax=Oceanobacillus sp. CFH 90083 TaxID=2592336 RepID=UPI00128CC0C8|nr:hypothetical protein [Oceanobacillus sp. CFH 90083]